MNAQNHVFTPIGGSPTGQLYRIAVSPYSTSALNGCMVNIDIGAASITLHEVGADDLRKLAFMLTAMAEALEPSITEPVNA